MQLLISFWDEIHCTYMQLCSRAQNYTRCKFCICMQCINGYIFLYDVSLYSNILSTYPMGGSRFYFQGWPNHHPENLISKKKKKKRKDNSRRGRGRLKFWLQFKLCFQYCFLCKSCKFLEFQRSIRTQSRTLLRKGSGVLPQENLSWNGLYSRKYIPSDTWTRHVFVKHGCPRQQQSQTMAKISKSYILTLHHPQGHVMSVKCEQPLAELTGPVWLLYDHPNFKYCTLFIRDTE